MMSNFYASASIQMLTLQVLSTHLLGNFRSTTIVIVYHELISTDIIFKETVAGSNETFMYVYVTNEIYKSCMIGILLSYFEYNVIKQTHLFSRKLY